MNGPLEKIGSLDEWIKLWNEFSSRRLQEMSLSLLHYLPEVVSYRADIHSSLLLTGNTSNIEKLLSDYFRAFQIPMNLVIHANYTKNQTQVREPIPEQAKKAVIALARNGYCGGTAPHFLRYWPGEQNRWWLDENYLLLQSLVVKYFACPWACGGKEPAAEIAKKMLFSAINILAGKDKSPFSLKDLLEANDLSDLIPKCIDTEFWHLTDENWQTASICHALINTGLIRELELAPTQNGLDHVLRARDTNWWNQKDTWKYEHDEKGTWWRLGMDTDALHKSALAIGWRLRKNPEELDFPESPMAAL